MIEKVVQREEEKGEKNVLFRLPKHIKQFGSGGNVPEIYIEDYAQGYLSRLAANDCSVCRVAVLVGEFIKSEEKRYVFIRGAIEAENAVENNTPKFSSEIWAEVYAKIKRFFPQYEAVGWFLGGPDFLTAINDTVYHTHLDWFGGRDRVLYRMDPIEKDSAFYLYEKGELVKWPGYYVYYEKNEEMQDFLVAGKPQSVDAGYTEPVLVRLGQRIGRKTENGQGDAGKPETGASFSGVEEKTEAGALPSGLSEKPEEAVGGSRNNPRFGTGMIAAAALLVVAATAFRYSKNRSNPVLFPTVAPEPAAQATQPVVQETLTRPTEILEVQGTAKPTGTPALFGGDFDTFFHPSEEPELPTGGISYVGNPKPTDSLTPAGTGDNTQMPAPTKTATKAPTNAPTNVLTETPKPTKKPEKEPTKEVQPTKEPEDTESGAGAGVFYMVKSGDTLAAICRSFYGNVSRLEEIKEVNQIPDENKIYAGQELFLPE